MDNRIIVSTLELQRSNPAATGDINLQNKAASASLPYAETPTPSASA